MSDVKVLRTGHVWKDVSEVVLDRVAKFPRDYEILDGPEEPTEHLPEPADGAQGVQTPDGDPEPTEPKGESLDDMGIKELREEADSLGLDYPGNASKAKLREMIEDFRAANPTE